MKVATQMEKLKIGDAIFELHKKLSGNDGIVIVSALGAIEYAIIRTLASKGYIEGLGGLYNYSGTFCLWVLAGIVGIAFFVGLLIQLESIIDYLRVIYKPNRLVFFLAVLYTSFLTTFAISTLTGGYFLGADLPIRGNDLNITSMIIIFLYQLSLFLITAEYSSNTTIFDNVFNFVLIASLISFFGNVYSEAKRKSIQENIEYCVLVNKHIVDESAYLKEDLCSKFINLDK